MAITYTANLFGISVETENPFLGIPSVIIGLTAILLVIGGMFFLMFYFLPFYVAGALGINIVASYLVVWGTYGFLRTFLDKN